MTLLIWQIFVYSFAFVLLGMLIGWFLRGYHFLDGSENDDLETELDECEQKVTQLNKEIAKLEKQLTSSKRSATKPVSARSSSKQSSSKQSSSRQSSSSSKSIKKSPASKSTTKKSSSKQTTQVKSSNDDLKKIAGVGKVIEGILHEANITTFAQVAKLKGEEIKRLSKELPNFKDRIERDDWLGQAKILHKEKYGKNP